MNKKKIIFDGISGEITIIIWLVPYLLATKFDNDYVNGGDELLPMLIILFTPLLNILISYSFLLCINFFKKTDE